MLYHLEGDLGLRDEAGAHEADWLAVHCFCL